jgi:7-cyano-7-deazaguanine synthase
MKSVVLFSSGLDSTYNLYAARQHSDVILALTIDYGQRAAAREIAHARAVTEILGVRHTVLSLPWFRDFTHSALVNRNSAVPQGTDVQIDVREVSEATARAVWVPNRNGILLNIAAGFAEGLGADWIVPGFNAEEAMTFADNSSGFLAALDTSFSFSTRNHVRTRCFSTDLNKTEIVRLARDLGVRFDLIWPCYEGGAQPCGQCESCQRFTRALRAHHMSLDLQAVRPQ